MYCTEKSVRLCYSGLQIQGTARFMNFLKYVQQNDLTCTVTVTDVKGLR